MRYVSFVVLALLSIQVFSQDIDFLPASTSGEVLSKRIINARPFSSIHEVKDVKGIGPKTFEDIQRKITAQ